MQLRYSLYLNSIGYSISAQAYLRAIQKVQPERSVKVSAINGISSFKKGVSEEYRKWFMKLRDTPAEASYISIQHCIPRIYISDKAQKRIGVAVYETIDPPRNWIEKMNEMDLIVTASHFNEGIFKNAGLRVPLRVVPHCFDSEMFHKDVRPSGRFNMFTFFYMGTWRKRKNFVPLLRAFYDGFAFKDNVCLLLKTDKSKQLKNTIRTVKNEKWKTKDTAPVYIEEETVDFEEIPKIMKKADVYISPSLGEGFNIPSAHAMALGIPLIITRYGGCLEFAKPELCTYLHPKGYRKIPQMDGLSQFAGKIWPNIPMEEIRDKMLFAYHSRKHIQEKAKQAYEYVHQHFNDEIIGRRLVSVIEELEN